MKKVIKTVFIGLMALSISGCDVLEGAAGTILTDSSEGNTQPKLTNQEVIAGLKEALTIGITNAVDLTSVTNGFLENNEIKLPFPESANAMKEKAIEWGLEGQVDKIVVTLRSEERRVGKECRSRWST